jgi:hypothetical protein
MLNFATQNFARDFDAARWKPLAIPTAKKL